MRITRRVDRAGVRWRPVIWLVLLAFLTANAWACKVPVFRYALERWNPDRYQMVVLTDHPLNTELHDALELLTQREAGQALADVTVVDISDPDQTLSPAVHRIVDAWKRSNRTSARAEDGSSGAVEAKNSPRLIAFYPEKSSTPVGRPAFASALSAPVIDQIRSSKARREVASRLASGQSAVWV